MVIDSNYCTIRMLEPIAEEITAMKIVEDGAEGGAQSPRFSLQVSLSLRFKGTHLYTVDCWHLV